MFELLDATGRRKTLIQLLKEMPDDVYVYVESARFGFLYHGTASDCRYHIDKLYLSGCVTEIEKVNTHYYNVTTR